MVRALYYYINLQYSYMRTQNSLPHLAIQSWQAMSHHVMLLKPYIINMIIDVKVYVTYVLTSHAWGCTTRPRAPSRPRRRPSSTPRGNLGTTHSLRSFIAPMNPTQCFRRKCRLNPRSTQLPNLSCRLYKFFLFIQ